MTLYFNAFKVFVILKRIDRIDFEHTIGAFRYECSFALKIIGMKFQNAWDFATVLFDNMKWLYLFVQFLNTMYQDCKECQNDFVR